MSVKTMWNITYDLRIEGRLLTAQVRGIVAELAQISRWNKATESVRANCHHARSCTECGASKGERCWYWYAPPFSSELERRTLKKQHRARYMR